MRVLGVLAVLGVAVHGSAQGQVGAAPDAAAPPALTAGGQVRQQYERFANEEWGSEAPDSNGYWLQRYMFHVDAKVSRRLRLFGQVKSGIEIGRAGGPRPPDEDDLDLHQGYVDVIFDHVTARVGRQELSYGSSRLVSIREGPNVRQSFDAVRAMVQRGDWRIDVFGGWVAQTRTGVFDDATDTGRALWGVYGVKQYGSKRTHGVDLYYLGYRRREARYDQGAGRERRHSVGARIWGSREPWDYNFEVVGQLGRFDEARIRAWTVASDAGYRLPLAGRPRLGLRADITSGDRDRTDDRLGTFNPMFPRGAYFGLVATTGPSNHRDLHPQVTVSIRDAATVTISWLFFWRDQIGDGLYGIPGNLLRSGAGTHSRFVGHSPGIEAEWQVNRHVSVTGNVSAFTAGPFVQQSGPPASDVGFVAAWATYRF